ncbi:Transposase [Fodinibius roseus]|uniref:Transposase n=1 Tax=Fodinibius roseus TaxID=1194090 RepID=A0A1M5G477_9BACT|nr:transposase [Fodinibius roseus]SHF98528.1 Transposase [Fodinibius roseus]
MVASPRGIQPPEGFQRLHRWLSSHNCPQQHTIIYIEDTGIYSDRLLASLSRQGWKCALLKTTATKKVAPEHHRKDDRFDARLLAEYGDRYADQIVSFPILRIATTIRWIRRMSISRKECKLAGLQMPASADEVP